MGGKAMGGRRVSLEEGMDVALQVTEFLLQKGAISSAKVAGSLRRKKPEVGDVDLVVIPDTGFNEVVGALFGWQKPKRKADPLKAKKSGLWNGVQVDLNPTTEDSMGAAMMFSTGSMETNIRQRVVAKAKGLLLNEKGLFRGEDKIAGPTEEGVYEALGLPFLKPEER